MKIAIEPMGDKHALLSCGDVKQGCALDDAAEVGEAVQKIVSEVPAGTVAQGQYLFEVEEAGSYLLVTVGTAKQMCQRTDAKDIGMAVLDAMKEAAKRGRARTEEQSVRDEAPTSEARARFSNPGPVSEPDGSIFGLVMDVMNDPVVGPKAASAARGLWSFFESMSINDDDEGKKAG